MGKFALLVGVSEYAMGLSPLPAARSDVEAMQRVLKHPRLCGFDQVKSLLSPERQVVEESIEELFTDRKKDDVVLLFFSGHGVKDERGNLHLATRTTRKTPQGTLFQSTAVSSRFIHEIMDQSRSKRQIVILDCCFSGAFAEGLTVKDDSSLNLKEQLGGEGRVVLTSSNSTQYSFEQKDSKLSIYTQYLVEGIETGVADRDGDAFVSVDELHEYASEKVQAVSQGMKPEIYAAKEGFKILLSRVPIGDPKDEYRKKIEQYVRSGEFYISPLEQSRRDLNTPAFLLKLRQSLGLTEHEAIAIEDEALRPLWESQVKVLTASADVNIVNVLLELLEAKLRQSFQQLYQNQKQEYADIAVWLTRTAIERINDSDAIFHTTEHAAWTILVGLELLKGKQIQEGGGSPEDWLHIVLALAFVHIGYVRGVCRYDRGDFLACSLSGEMVSLAPGMSDATLAPYTVERAKLFVEERFGGHRLINADFISSCLSLTHFPLPPNLHPDDKAAKAMSYQELVQAATLISQVSHPKFPGKLSLALFYELEEIGMSQALNYRTPDDLRRNYPLLFCSTARPHIQPAFHYLMQTEVGQQLLISVYSNLFVMAHSPQGGLQSTETPAKQLNLLQKMFELNPTEFAALEEGIEVHLNALLSDRPGKVPVVAEVDLTDALLNSLEIKLKAAYREVYGLLKYDYANLIGAIAHTALNYIDGSDALYHDIDHAIRVTLVGIEILYGKQIREGSVTAEDWLHVVVSLLCANVGYVKGICNSDQNGWYATGIGDEVISLPPGASDASLTPYHIDRSKLFVDEQFGGHPVIDAEKVKQNIELTRFPVPRSEDHQDTINYPGLVRAASLIGQLGDPRYLEKAVSIFYEFKETGINQALGYHSPGDIRRDYPKFFWNSVYPYIRDALDYLALTQQGKQTIANLHSNIFIVEHAPIDTPIYMESR